MALTAHKQGIADGNIGMGKDFIQPVRSRGRSTGAVGSGWGLTRMGGQQGCVERCGVCVWTREDSDSLVSTLCWHYQFFFGNTRGKNLFAFSTFDPADQKEVHGVAWVGAPPFGQGRMY
jgi:hypothetical protein